MPKSNQNTFEYKSFRSLAPTIWNTLPTEIQAETKLEDFKTKIGRINLAWCSCQKCCDKQNKSNTIYNMASNFHSRIIFSKNSMREGGNVLIVHRHFIQ